MIDEAIITDADTQRLRDLTDRLLASGRGRPDHVVALRHRLNSATIVSAKAIPRNVVTMNSRVSVRDVETGNRMVLTLTDPFGASIPGYRLPVSGPCGVALLGKRVGEIIHWRLGSKTRRMRVEQVLYQPEAAGDHHL